MAFDSANFKKPQVDEVGQIILKARELLSDPAKWCKGKYEYQGAFCVLGALGFRNEEDPIPAEEDAAYYVASVLSTSTGDMFDVIEIISDFNDAETTTHADILDLLDRAAKATPSLTEAEG